eukprot:9651622-Alexandrium_andersonii.AAC.1
MDEGMRQATTSPPADKGWEHEGGGSTAQTGQKGAAPPPRRAPRRCARIAEPARGASKGLAGTENMTGVCSSLPTHPPKGGPFMLVPNRAKEEAVHMQDTNVRLPRAVLVASDTLPPGVRG